MEKVSPTAGAVCNGCLVYEQQGQHVVVLVDTPSWYTWLETATTFTFTGEQGTFTAHKARAGNRRGGWYWRAYRRKRGRLSRCYLGVSTNLTLAKLCEVARCLAADGKGTGNSQTGDDTPPPVPVPLAPQGLTSTVILQSSITPPRLPVQHVARPRLLALLEQGRPAAMTPPASLPSPFKPLSEREHEVLQLVAEGLSNQQIAQHLVLSLHTVKLHSNISWRNWAPRIAPRP